MSEYRINKLHGILLEDDRVPNLIENQFDSSTRTMLENLVREGDGTTVLQLDPSNTGQGYIGYSRPSNTGEEDDYFNFDSFNYSVRLNLDNDGIIVTTGDGKLYNNYIKIMSQTPGGNFTVYFTIPGFNMENANKPAMIDKIKELLTIVGEISVTGGYNVAQGDKVGQHVIIAMSLNQDNTLHFVSPTAQQLDSDADWSNGVTIKSVPIN